MLKSLVLALALMGLTGCSSLSSKPIPQAWLKPGVQITLPAPGHNPVIQTHQLLKNTYRGQEHSLMVLLQADTQHLTLVGLSPVGIRLFTLRYDPQGMTIEQSIAAPGLPPAAQVLADIMLSYWPQEAWNLPPGWRLIDTPLQRQLLDDQGKVVTQITYEGTADQRQPIQVQQHAFGYEITIQTLDN